MRTLNLLIRRALQHKYLALGILVILALITLGLIQNRGSKDENDNSIYDFEVTIINIRDYENKLGAGGMGSLVADQLVRLIRNNTHKVPSDNLAANIRDNSLSKEMIDNIPSYTFLVDIPQIKQTYRAHMYGGDNYEHFTVQVECPDSNQLAWKDQKCDDGENGHD